MKTLGVLGATGVSSTGLAAARGASRGKEGLEDISVDVVLNYSVVDETSDTPNTFDHYGYPYPAIRPPDASGGFYFARTDPATSEQSSENPSFFDISEIKLTPNGNTLHHSLQFFASYLISDDSKMKPYPLVHTGDGRFVSRGQVMNFKSRNRNELEETFAGLPPFQYLTKPGDELPWRAVCTDRIQLMTDADGNPTTTPEWGLTRTDFYSLGRGRPEFTISLLYTIWNPNITPKPNHAPSWTAIPPEIYDGTSDGVMYRELIEPGRLNMGGK